MNRIFSSSLLRFLLVGVANTLVGSAVMFGLYNLAGCSYWVSSAANYLVGSVLSFFLNKYFTFRNRERSWGQVLRFIVNIAVCYLLAYGLAKPAVRMLLSSQSVTVQENAAMFAGMVLFTGLNYFGQRFFAFR
ncbi:MAG: GtrA family protein [Oscillospiraceae bacterium]|nr:MAG: GtrA family protein [Oscillospiraceae bacterium]